MHYKNGLPTNCPDPVKEVITDDRKFYRATNDAPPTDEDFIPLWQQGKITDSRKECMARGISIYENLEDIIATMKQFGKIGKYVYSGIIRYKIDGIVQITHGFKPSHRTWYPYEDTDEKNIFQVREK